MTIHVKVTEAVKAEADLLAVFVFAAEGKTGTFEMSEEAKRIDAVLNGMLAEIAIAEGFEAKKYASILLHTHGKIAAKRVLLMGIGRLKELTPSDWQYVAGTIVRRAKAIAAKTVAVALPRNILDHLDAHDAGRGCSVGLALGDYTFLKHKSEDVRKKEKTIDNVLLLVHPSILSKVSAGVTLGTIESRAVIFTRDLVNEPPSETTPTFLAETARAIAERSTHISCQVFGKSQIEKLGMGGLLGIAQGSAQEPKFIHLSYRGRGKTVALIGKGITFDTGGLSIKSSSGMETMKLDMAGAAVILGVFHVLAELKPAINIEGLIAATENMPGGRAIKPGDVVTAMNGKTIEILNTDAEGRVILADALSYAALKVKPDVMIDVATLTGACVVALGEDIAGLFSNNRDLARKLSDAAEASGEKIWELPLVKEYTEMIKSGIADLKNSTKTRYAGAITAALFLSEFVPKAVPWAHLDIAGPAFAEKGTAVTQTGGTGFGVRTILTFLSVTAS